MKPSSARCGFSQRSSLPRSRSDRSSAVARETWRYLLDDGRVTVVFAEGKVVSVQSQQTKR